MIMANCIQQNWDSEAAARLAAAADDLATTVPVSSLSFLPDVRIRDYLLLRATEEKILAAEALSEMLCGGRGVTVTAGGYSMWPAIKPGDRVRISPPEKESTPERGMVVALRRDGGFVVHRVTDVRGEGPADYIGTSRSEDHAMRENPTDRFSRAGPADQIGSDCPADRVGSGRPADHIGNDGRADQHGRGGSTDQSVSGSPGQQIRTRGDTSLRADPWIRAGDIAGLVTLVTAEGDTIPVPRRRFPYLAGSLAATAAQLWYGIAGRK